MRRLGFAVSASLTQGTSAGSPFRGISFNLAFPILRYIVMASEGGEEIRPRTARSLVNGGP
jgi:hypothetical protein